MAKALFHKMQRVFVKPVGTWALVERVIPHWVKNVQEPLRVTYDVGLGREFLGSELVSEASMNKRDVDGLDEDGGVGHEHWRVLRMKSKWHAGEVNPSHPYPGTFPVVVTDPQDWGGWRVPGAEYDRDPARIEHQARLIAAAPDMLKLIKQLAQLASEQSDEIPAELIPQLKRCSSILRLIYDIEGEDSSAVAAE